MTMLEECWAYLGCGLLLSSTEEAVQVGVHHADTSMGTSRRNGRCCLERRKSMCRQYNCGIASRPGCLGQGCLRDGQVSSSTVSSSRRG